jgi:Ca-activated chloride channel family protein
VPTAKPDYYAVLGVLRDASPEDIKRAYYASARRLHPDMNKLAGETEIFLEVQRAYEVLSNPQRRAMYDATLPQETSVPILDCSAQYSRPSLVHLNESQLIYVLLEVAPHAAVERASVIPLNTCLVLDRSTSMQGEKMDVAKASAIEIMRMMRPEDIFGLVVFGDRAEVILPSTFLRDQNRLQGRVQTIQPAGATEIYQGLAAGLAEVRRSLDPNRSNHLILLTDGHTYGDEAACLELAQEAAALNVGISGFGVGSDWNDIFLDRLASCTGGNSTYISNPQDIRRLLAEKFKAFERIFVDDLLMESTRVEGVELRYAFRLQPDGGPVQIQDSTHLGPILHDTPLIVLLEFLVDASASGAQTVTLLEGALKAVVTARPTPIAPIRLKLDREVGDAARAEPPPPEMQRALSRLALYRLQERARQEADEGEFESATRHLRSLAAQLASQGQHELAKTTLLEVENLSKLQAYSGGGGKEIKYGTRALLLSTTENLE